MHPGQVDVDLKFCHLNLNGIIARDRIKIPLIDAYNFVFHYDIIALSETIINISAPDEDIFIEGFSEEIFRSDHPSGDKKSGAFIFFKETFPIKRRKDLESMRETVVTEITLRREKIFFVAIYRSPNQNSEEFDLFQESLQNIIDNFKDLRPHCVILTGDFNCRSNQWWPGDKNLPEGIALDDLYESYNITQLIDQPTNIEPRGISCVDMIVTNKPNLFIDHGILRRSTTAVTTKLFMGNSTYPFPHLPLTKDKFETIQKLEKTKFGVLLGILTGRLYLWILLLIRSQISLPY